VAEAWTCSQCGAVNEPSFVVCHECGQVRPDLDRAAVAAATEPSAEVPADIPAASAAASPTPAEPLATDSTDVVAGTADSSPAWTPPTEWRQPTTPGGFPAGPSEGWAATQPTQPNASTAPPTGWATPDASAAPPTGWASPGAVTTPGQVAPPPAPGALPGWTTGPPRQPSMLRRIPIGWIVVIVLIAGGALVGWYVNAARSSTGEIDKAGDMSATDLRVGDCFDLKDPSEDTIEDVRAVPCTTQHTYELFFRGDMPNGDYPTDDAFDSWTTSNCDPAFATYVGRSYEQSTLEVYYLVPTSDAWASGDRSVQCALYPSNDTHPTTSLKGSQQ
jgi:hypothetical protein